MQFPVVVVGSCNVDQITVVPDFMKPGQTIRGSSYAIGCGGKGANQAVMAGKLGIATAMVSRVGTDAMGDMFLNNFASSGVDGSHVQKTADTTTGVATILVNENTGQNAIAIVGGANDIISIQDVEKSAELISQCAVLLTQNEIADEATLRAMQIGIAANKPLVIWNAAPAPTKINLEMIKTCHILCVNETEAEAMAGIAVSNVDDAALAAAKLREMGAKQVLITLGQNGSVFFDEDAKKTFVDSVKVNPVDTTGAGDAYLGALAFFISHKLPIAEAMSRAAFVAAESVKGQGTQTSFPTRAQLPQHLFDSC